MKTELLPFRSEMIPDAGNLLASRFSPRFGFKDVAYRVSKKVSPMIAWAKDE